MLSDDPHLVEAGVSAVPVPAAAVAAILPPVPGVPRFTARAVRVDETTTYVIVHDSDRDTREMFDAGGVLRPDARARCFIEDRAGLISFYQRFNINFTPRAGAYILYCMELVRGDDEDDLDDIDENFEALAEEEQQERDEDEAAEDDDAAEDEEIDPGDRKDLADAPQPDAPASTIIDLGSIFGGGGAVVNRQQKAIKPAAAAAALAEKPAAPKAKPVSADAPANGGGDSPVQIGRQSIYYEVPPGYVKLYIDWNQTTQPRDRVLHLVERQVEESRVALSVVAAYLADAKKHSVVSFSGNNGLH